MPDSAVHPDGASATTPLRILQACATKSWGGLEMYAVDTALALAARGHHVAFLCAEGSTIEEKVKAAGLEAFPLLNGPLRPIGEIYSLLKSDHYDVIHTHLSHDLGVLVPAIRLSGWKGKLFFSRQMISGISKKDLLHQFLYRRIDGLFAVSNAVRQNVIDTCPIDPDKVHLLWNTIRPSDFDPGKYDTLEIRQELGIDPETTVVGIVGRITPKKGHKEFIEAANTVLQSTDKKICFLVVGGASYEEEDFEAEIHRLATAEYRLGENIRFTGFRPDISRMMAAMDIFVFPSYKEAFGITLLEAMAMKLPIIASNNGGVPDIIIDKESGLLVPPQNAEALAAAMLTLLNEDTYLKKFAEEGRKRVEAHFTFSAYIKKLEERYSFSSTEK